MPNTRDMDGVIFCYGHGVATVRSVDGSSLKPADVEACGFACSEVVPDADDTSLSFAMLMSDDPPGPLQLAMQESDEFVSLRSAVERNGSEAFKGRVWKLLSLRG